MVQDWREQLKKAGQQSGQRNDFPQTSDIKKAVGQGISQSPNYSRSQRASQPQEKLKELTSQYLQHLRSGYFDDSGYIREEFIIFHARELAKTLEEGENQGRIKMTRSLLRNFYAEVMDIKHLLRGGRPFEALRPRIWKLNAFAHNAVTRRTSRAPQIFYDFISENVKVGSKDPHSFLDGFCQHFECIVLYFKGR